MRVRRCGAQPQVLDRSADGEVIKTLPIVPRQTERAMQHIVEVTTNARAAHSGGLGGQVQRLTDHSGLPANGSGKTTTIRMIVNIFYPDRGQIRVLGHQMSGARNHLIGYLPEERGLYRKMQVRPLLEFFGEVADEVI